MADNTLEQELKAVVDRSYRITDNGATKEDFKLADPEGIVSEPGDLVSIHASLQILCKQIGDFLEREYSGWLWMIQPDQSGGIVNILSQRLHPNYGTRYHIDLIHDDPQLRIVKSLVGEMFERFGLPRKPFHMCRQEYNAAPRNAFGYLIPDLSDKADKDLMSTELLEQGRTAAYLRRKGGISS